MDISIKEYKTSDDIRSKNKEYKVKNWEKIKDQNDKYRKDNAQKYRDMNRKAFQKYYENNREEIIEKNSNRYYANKVGKYCKDQVNVKYEKIVIPMN